MEIIKISKVKGAQKMITRACISINNRCNLNCLYCHFHEKKSYINEKEMNVFTILDNIFSYIDNNDIELFKLGFVGNGEPLLDYDNLKKYILYIEQNKKSCKISIYTITNGLLIDKEKLVFFKNYNVNVGFSIDGIKKIHDKNRCNTFDLVMEKIQLYNDIYGKYPSMNCTVGKDVLDCEDETIEFFSKFDNRITFSRMIGNYGISLEKFNSFISKASSKLNVRTGGYDCTMYGGMCGAGIDNIFYANNNIYICGNCIDLPYKLPYNTPLEKVNFNVGDFDRKCCFKEVRTK